MQALPALLLLVLFLGGFTLWLWALLDAIRTPADHAFRAGTKLKRILIILLAQPVGALLYLALGRPPKTPPL